MTDAKPLPKRKCRGCGRELPVRMIRNFAVQPSHAVDGEMLQWCHACAEKVAEELYYDLYNGNTWEERPHAKAVFQGALGRVPEPPKEET